MKCNVSIDELHDSITVIMSVFYIQFSSSTLVKHVRFRGPYIHEYTLSNSKNIYLLGLYAQINNNLAISKVYTYNIVYNIK